jgi:hypothetical protein
MKIKQEFEAAVHKIIKAFEKKQDLEFQFFVGDDVTDVAFFGDVDFFKFSDIYHDITTNQPKGLIKQCLYECLDHDNYINYKSYCMGLRHENIK